MLVYLAIGRKIGGIYLCRMVFPQSKTLSFGFMKIPNYPINASIIVDDCNEPV